MKDIPQQGDFRTRARIDGTYNEIAENVSKCVFCDLRDKYIITRQDSWVLTVNIHPYINGQLLVIPERHVESYQDLTPDDILISDRLIRKGIDLLKREIRIENYWIVLRQGELSGKTVKHLHWNIIPYEEGLNTWHYREITVHPIDLAATLRSSFKNEGT